MKFLHNTSITSAQSIINSKNIYESAFDVQKYIEEFLEKISEETDSKELPSEYHDDSRNYVPWLGRGVYCYSEFDIKLAKNYKKNQGDRAVIAIKVDVTEINDDSFFNMDSQESRRLLRLFLEEDLKKMAFSYYDEGKEQLGNSVLFLREILLENFKNYYEGFPYAAGIILDLFLASSEKDYHIVRGSFKKGSGKGKKNFWIDTYFTIKESNVISSLEQIC